MSNTIPKSILDAVAEAEAQHPGCIERAKACALTKVTALAEYKDFVEVLAARAIGQLLEERRHEFNVEMRRAAGFYGQPAKKQGGTSVNEIYCRHYSYRIGGKILGDLTGAELQQIAGAESSRAHTHLFNSRLCAELARLTPENVPVRMVVKEADIARIWRQIDREGGNAEGA